MGFSIELIALAPDFLLLTDPGLALNNFCQNEGSSLVLGGLLVVGMVVGVASLVSVTGAAAIGAGVDDSVLLSGGKEEAPPKTLFQKDSVFGLSAPKVGAAGVEMGGKVVSTVGTLLTDGLAMEPLGEALEVSVGLTPSSFRGEVDEAASNIPRNKLPMPLGALLIGVGLVVGSAICSTGALGPSKAVSALVLSLFSGWVLDLLGLLRFWAFEEDFSAFAFLGLDFLFSPSASLVSPPKSLLHADGGLSAACKDAEIDPKKAIARSKNTKRGLKRLVSPLLVMRKIIS